MKQKDKRDQVFFYPDHSLLWDEYAKILEFTQAYALGEPARLSLAATVPIRDRNQIEFDLNIVEELSWIVGQYGMPLSYYTDITTALQRSKVENYVLPMEDVLAIRSVVTIYQEVLRFLSKEHRITFRNLDVLITDTNAYAEIVSRFNLIFDEDAQVNDSASAKLQELRYSIKSKKREIEKRFAQIVQTLRQKGMLTETAESVRNGRLVLSLPSENKRKLKGIIHDESVTGKTVFVEPEEIIELNNQLNELEADERREIYHILQALCAFIGERTELLQLAYEHIVLLDCYSSKARLALDMKAIKPELVEDHELTLVQAKHPLLFLKNNKQGKPTIPFDLTLRESERILVISGPNAGGKSVLLKSVGLLQMMFQSGYLIPTGKGTALPIFSKVLCDIGDNQSLDDDLSTYSARLKYMKQFLIEANPQSLLLIDEFGSGTDPKVGGALAEAVLHFVQQKKPFGIITTHYSNIKLYASKQEGFVNGTMIFDKEHLQATYRLQVGRPGSSFAFEMAQKIGLPKHVLQLASKKAGKEFVAVDDLLVGLQKEKLQLEEEIKSLKQKQKQLDSIIKTYTELQKQLDIKRMRLRLEQKEFELFKKQEQHKALDKLVKEIREQQDVDRAKVIVSETKQEKEQLLAEYEEGNKGLNKLISSGRKLKNIETGDDVRILMSGLLGKAGKINKGKIEVITEHMSFSLKLDQVEYVEPSLTANAIRSVRTDQVDKIKRFESTLDLRGMRFEEAIQTLDYYLDDAIMSNASKVEIIHGFGNGSLKQAVQRALKQHKFIAKYYHPQYDSGGEGVTIAELT